tara:strand:- start:5521 stop:6744 length:1224 start_codon:yes stop_codon:yes gene_type:complete
MDSIKFKEERADVISSLEAIKDLATTEERDLTSDENNQVDGLLQEADDLSAKISRAEKMEKALRTAAAVSGEKVSKNVEKEIRDYSFQDAMKAAYTGNVEGLVKEMDQEARNNARYTGQSYKGIAIPSSVLTRAAVETAAGNSTQSMSWSDQLEANLVLASAGANFYSGVENMKFPVFSSINSGFVAESGGTAPAANGTASSITLSPKKLISIVNVSAEAMMQNAGLEAALRRNMAASVAATLEQALLADADVTNGPESIFLDAATQTVAGAAPVIAEILAMESELISNGVNLQGARMAWLLDGNALAEIKTLAQVASVSPVYDNVAKELAGYFAFTSSNVGSTAGTGSNYLLGDFSKVHVAQFGGIDMLFDPYTNAGTGEGRMVVTSLVDGNAVQNNTAFIKINNA